MRRVERHTVLKSNINYKQIDNLSFACKNLYNKANYIVRQTFFKTTKLVKSGELEHAKWTSYSELDKLAKFEKWEEYRKLPAKTAQQILMSLEKNWKSFFVTTKTFKTNGSSGKPKLPNYKHKTKGRYVVIFTAQQAKLKKGYIHFPKYANLCPIKTKQINVKQVRIVPQTTCYIVEIIYEKEEIKNENLKSDLYLGIDLGLNNLVTATSNGTGLQPFIINGRPLKAINQYYNKMKALYQSYVGPKGTSNKLSFLLHKRNNKIQNYLHHTSRFIINYCQEHNIGNIVIGKNDGWKNRINIGKKSNQNFVQIPFTKLIKQIQYKAEEVGIEVQLTEESYTSKASFLDKDFLPVFEKGIKHTFSGKRVRRGLYKSKSGQLINADVNGSLNILRKAIPNLFSDGIEGLELIPIKMSI
jgi:putative transposase